MNVMTPHNNLALHLRLEELLKQRFMVVERVGVFKKAENIAPLDESRWNQILGRLKVQGDTLGLSPEVVQDVWNKIHDIALKIEEDLKTTPLKPNTGETLNSMRQEIDSLDTQLLELLRDLLVQNKGHKLILLVDQVLERVSKTLGF